MRTGKTKGQNGLVLALDVDVWSILEKPGQRIFIEPLTLRCIGIEMTVEESLKQSFLLIAINQAGMDFPFSGKVHHVS